jgi:hypothetical protein
MTLKQFAKANFLDALEAYSVALRSKDSRAIIAASVRVWGARADVPKSWHALINRAYRESGQIAPVV